MTICACVKVPEGIVLATDSITSVNSGTWEPKKVVIKTWSNQKKLFQVGSLPIGVMHYGTGKIGGCTIARFIREFKPPTKNVKEVARLLSESVRAAYVAEYSRLTARMQPFLGLYFAGYSNHSCSGEEWDLQLPNDPQPCLVRKGLMYGTSWRGADRTFTRLIKGYDPDMFNALVNAGVNAKLLKKTVAKFEFHASYETMPVQDAVNLAVYILRITIGSATLFTGANAAPACGGPLQVAAILPDTGFKWLMNSPLTVREEPMPEPIPRDRPLYTESYDRGF